MSDYAKITTFTPKDSLPTGDSEKLVLGSELDAEFDAIATAVATKANSASVPILAGSNTFTGTQIISSTQPVLRLNETDAALNEKVWSIFGDAGLLKIEAREDNNAPGTVAVAIDRSGTTVGPFTFNLGSAASLVLSTSGAATFSNGTVTGAIGYSVTPTFQLGTTSAHNLDLYTNGTTRLTIRQDGTFTQQALTVATLPAAVSGARAFVTDANATTFASIVAGGGSNRVPVYSDGTNWRIG